jgi:cytochrome bd-type quinol oxidase subunit 1
MNKELANDGNVLKAGIGLMSAFHFIFPSITKSLKAAFMQFRTSYATKYPANYGSVTKPYTS